MTTMISDAKICAVLEQEFPDLDFCKDKNPEYRDVYSYLNCLSLRTSQWMKGGQLQSLEHCFNLMNKLYRHCSRRVQAAIENVYLYHLTRSINHSDRRWEIKQLLPASFRDVVYRHTFSGAI
jgi:hypothetical protein